MPGDIHSCDCDQHLVMWTAYKQQAFNVLVRLEKLRCVADALQWQRRIDLHLQDYGIAKVSAALLKGLTTLGGGPGEVDPVFYSLLVQQLDSGEPRSTALWPRGIPSAIQDLVRHSWLPLNPAPPGGALSLNVVMTAASRMSGEATRVERSC
jgi:hypothetical protein